MQIFLTAFQSVPDPRAANTSHDLSELLMIAFLAVLCGAQNCSEMVTFGRAKIEFLKCFLCLKNGIPSHDTFSAVFRAIDPKALDRAFGELTAALVEKLGRGDVIAIDGKSLRGAYDKGEASSPRMMVSAYASELRLTLATVEADNRNEVDAALEVLGLVDLKGKIVTGDALHCNRKAAAQIIDQGGDYCLALKGNQKALLSEAHSEFSKERAKTQVARQKTKDHGRRETRTATIFNVKGMAETHDFSGLKAFGRIEATREIDGKVEQYVRFFALSRKASPAVLLKVGRQHWQIENGLHWQLDVTFGEDAARNRKDNGPPNIAVLRRRALDVARRDKSKGSLTGKIKRAG